MAQKIVSIELPEDSHYKITKTKAVKDSFFIEQGHVVIGELISNPITINSRCTVCHPHSSRDSISTSYVVDIKLDKKNPRKIILHTENSVYTLEEIDGIE